MSRVEVLVATMNQTDLSLFEKMNIQTDVIFCNQCDKNEFVETQINGHRVRMLFTTTRGVGINRNLAMQLSEAEICLCADDDLVYVDGYEQLIVNEFDNYKQADIIGFSLIDSQTNRVFAKTKKRKRFLGAACMAFRNKKVKKSNISFTRLFGGGCVYGSGEDSLFCASAKKSGLTIYQSKEIIAKLIDRESSWFCGYNEKYYFDKGAWCKATYPKTYRFLKYYLVFKLARQSEFGFFKVAKLMNQGAKAFKNCEPYKQVVKEEKTEDGQ